MKKSFTLIFSIFFLLFFVSCDKEENRIVNFLVEFATIAKTETSTTIILDDSTILTPENDPNLNLENMDRIILNYTPLENGLININSVRPIFQDTIKEEGYPNEIETSPIKIISIWVSGNYLNMSLQVDYHSKQHTAALIRDMDADENNLYFIYSREDDPLGAPTLRYISFNLEKLQKQNFTIHINTYDEERVFSF